MFVENKKITIFVNNNINKHLCACGCGNFIQVNRTHFRLGIPKYIQGHNSIANKEKIRETVLNYFKTEKGKLQAKQHSVFFKEYRKTHAFKKPTRTNEQIVSNAKLLKEKYKNGELSPWNKNKVGVYSKETIKKMALAKFGRCGILASNWKNGLSLKPYPTVFNYELRSYIRNRDDYICIICKLPESAFNRNLDVHHIDYNKENCQEDNLISLCQNCHQHTNGNRDYWKIVLQGLVKLYV
jgi:hypothetical protein